MYGICRLVEEVANKIQESVHYKEHCLQERTESEKRKNNGKNRGKYKFGTSFISRTVRRNIGSIVILTASHQTLLSNVYQQ